MRARLFLIGAMALTLVSCADAPKPRGMPNAGLSYTHLTPYRINQGAMVLNQSYQTVRYRDEAARREALGLDMAIPLPSLVERYLKSRLAIMPESELGAINNNALKVTVDVQSLNVSRKITEGSLGGIFGGDEEIILKGIITMTPQVGLAPPWNQGYKLTAQRRLIVNANMSLADKERAELELLEAFILDIDQKLTPLFN